MREVAEVVPFTERKSAITSQSIGVDELTALLTATSADETADGYARAIEEDNVLGLKTETSKDWRVQTLRRLYQLRPDSTMFRALRDLWDDDPDAQPLLAGLAAMTRDTVFRATAEHIVDVSVGEEVAAADFIPAIEKRFPGAYKQITLETISKKAYSSWGQTRHLGPPDGGVRQRTRATCRPANVAYALMLGHLEGDRGEALFETLWAQMLDQPISQLHELAFAASRRGMLGYRSGGGVIEVTFDQLLRPMEGQLL